MCGCASLTNPVADGIPVRQVPPELLVQSKSGYQSVPLNLLRQPPPNVYRLAPGDVLGIHVEGFLGKAKEPAPTHVGPVLKWPQQRMLPPASGYPVTVEADGTIDLPLAGSLRVAGLTIQQARESLRQFYVEKELIRAEINPVMVTLLTPRQHQVLVFRPEAKTYEPDRTGLNQAKRGIGQLVQLPAYENDVLHALAATGGLPGQDALNRVVIFRDCFHDSAGAGVLLTQLNQMPPPTPPNGQPLPPPLTTRTANVTCIPLRVGPGELLRVPLKDIVLQTGDVVYLEPREDAYFYTGGLLPPGMYPMPSDADLDVVEAVCRVKGPLFNGVGNPAPSLLVVVRKTPNCGQVSIAVDLRKAMREPQERILLQPGDVLLLQERPGEAVARHLMHPLGFGWAR